MDVFLATDSDGTLSGWGRTEAWARFDAARCNLHTCYAMDCWPQREDGSVRAWADDIAVARLTIHGEEPALHFAAIVGTPFAEARRYVERVHAGELDQIGPEPPWEVLPEMRLVEDWWMPVDYEPVTTRHGHRFAVRELRRDAQGCWRMTGLPVEPGDQLEVFHDGHWCAGTVTEAPYEGLRFELRRRGGTVVLPERVRVVPIRMLGGDTRPILDPLPPAEGEVWCPF